MTAEGSTGSPRRARARGRRALLAAGGAWLVAAAAGTAWVQSGAGADPVSTDVPATCSIAGSNAAVTVPMTVDDLVDPVAPGGAQTLHVDQGLGTLPVEVTVNQVVVTTPIPAQVGSTDSVTFEGGNMAGSYAVEGTNLVVTFTGPQTSSQLQFPRVVVNQTISDTAAAPIQWQVWSSMVTETNYGTATCAPDDPGTVLNTTAISAGGGSPEPTTTVPGDDPTTTTTAPETTTTTTTLPPTEQPEAPAPGVEVCVEVTSPVPAPLPIPCPVTVPPAGDGSPILPSLPAPPAGAGLPAPQTVPPTGGSLPLPLPAPPTGGGLPLPLPGGDGGGGLNVDIDVRIGVTV